MDADEHNPYHRLIALMREYRRAVQCKRVPASTTTAAPPPSVSAARMLRDVVDVAAQWRQQAMVTAFAVDAGPPPGRRRRLGEMKP